MLRSWCNSFRVELLTLAGYEELLLSLKLLFFCRVNYPLVRGFVKTKEVDHDLTGEVNIANCVERCQFQDIPGLSNQSGVFLPSIRTVLCHQKSFKSFVSKPTKRNKLSISHTSSNMVPISPDRRSRTLHLRQRHIPIVQGSVTTFQLLLRAS